MKNKAISATFWSGIDTFARKGIQFGFSLVMARLLTPEDYGVFGVLTVFIAVCAAFIDSGFYKALVQRKEVSTEDLSSVFYFNIGISLLAAVLLCVAAPWIAAFYAMPVLTPLTRLLAANLFLGSFCSIQSVLLTRALDFRRQCMISLAAIVVSGVGAIILAWQGYGVWSLGIQSIVATATTVVLLWGASAWRPWWGFSLASIRSLFGFGGFVLLTTLVDTLFTRLNTLVIGKFYSAQDLGQYSRADGTSILPGDIISGILGRAAFPIFAAAQHDKEMLRAGLRKAITMVMMLNIPIMIGMAVTAKNLVLVLFGPQWLPCVPYLQILSIGGTMVPLHMLNLNVLLAQGHSNLNFRLELIKKSIAVVVLGSTCFISITAIAWGSAFTAIIWFWINAYYSGRLLGYGFMRQTRDLMPYIGVASLMAFASYLAIFLPLGNPLLVLTAQVVIGCAVYVTLCALFRLQAFVDARGMILPVIGKFWMRS